MKLYESAGVFARLFEDFEDLCAEPEKNENGDYIDQFGTVISDVAAYLQERQEAWFDTLSGIEEEFDVKAENVAAYIKSLKAEADALKAEEAALSRRRKAKENQLERMKAYLLENMLLINRQKIDTPRAKLSIRTNPESVQFDDENEFITMCEKTGMEDYLRYKAPEINKTAVKERLKSGLVLDGVRLIRTQSLIIK